jgi:hypothetical protein
LNKWISALLNLGRNQLFFTKSGRGKNKGMLWASLLSIGFSAAAYLFKRERKRNVSVNMTSPFQSREPSYKPNIAAIVESAEDLTPDIKAYKGKSAE